MSSSRRDRIVEALRASPLPVTGSELAHRLGVSRQIVVQDVAILRAAGEDIIATPQGYVLAPNRRAHRAVLAVGHSPADTASELTALVESGVRVLDVVVEHPLYGELHGNLMLGTRDDVLSWVARWRESHAELLSTLTHGVHLHTVEATTPTAIERARDALRRLGFLLEPGQPG
ncbi:MAG: transcription repressor NadR [Chloroflexi bacterium]|nr:transcription repressor NadR [Chloroflexota bacterium]